MSPLRSRFVFMKRRGASGAKHALRSCPRRKLLEHLLDVFIELLRVLFGVAGKIAARRSSPHQLFRVTVEYAYDQGSDFVVVNSRCRVSHAHAPPAPTTEAVVEGVVLLMNRSFLNCDQRDISAGGHLSPSLGCQVLIDGVLHPVVPNGVRRLNL